MSVSLGSESIKLHKLGEERESHMANTVRGRGYQIRRTALRILADRTLQNVLSFISRAIGVSGTTTDAALGITCTPQKWINERQNYNNKKEKWYGLM